MKDFSTMGNVLSYDKNRADCGAAAGKAHSYIKKVETVEPFFIRKIPLWKRTLDICGALFGLMLFSPLFLVIAALIKIASSGPVFFKQKRIGFGAQEFNFWKFRTMKVNANTTEHRKHLSELINGEGGDCGVSGKPMTKLDKDNPNIIPFGRFLRNSCLDELPQLINVLLGDMSLVGPRPPIPYEVEEYLIWHKGRFDGLPGMTGLWQVSGKNRLTFKEMIRLDIQYERQMSLITDLRILLMTPWAILNEYRYSRQGTCI